MTQAAARQRDSYDNVGLIFQRTGHNVEVLTGFDIEGGNSFASKIDELHTLPSREKRRFKNSHAEQ